MRIWNDEAALRSFGCCWLGAGDGAVFFLVGVGVVISLREAVLRCMARFTFIARIKFGYQRTIIPITYLATSPKLAQPNPIHLITSMT